jgi:molybdenum cofactor biosynthesis enzyme MoaA
VKNNLSHEIILKVAKSFENAQYTFSNESKKKIDLAGLEPTLWRDGRLTIFDLIKILTCNGFNVHLTTNGWCLYDHVDDFKNSGVALIRVSLHSMDPEIYSRITKQNNLEKVKLGIEKAREKGLNIKVNRLLIKGYLWDLPEQIEFCKKLGVPLKLYSLIPQCKDDPNFLKYFVSEFEVIEKFLTGNYNVKIINKNFKRTRIIFSSEQIGTIEFKIFSIDHHINHHYCSYCDLKTICREYFAEYLRFDSNYKLHFCLYRHEYSLDLSEIIHEDEDKIVNFLKNKLEEVFLKKVGIDKLPYLSLRFIITENCNYRCSFPSGNLWCHSEGIF